MQPSLNHILVPERIARLAALGWQLDPNFGNYIQVFPADMPVGRVTDQILQVLTEVYDADVSDLKVKSDWVKSQLCPPRNGPTQNLAGMINDAPEMASTAIRTCAYKPTPNLEYTPIIRSVSDLVLTYGTRVSGELQRLRINEQSRVFLVLATEIGYVQCEPGRDPEAIYCEAQSADSWPALASILTAERIERLHSAGYADPGRGPNYWKIYPADKFDNTSITRELLTILYAVYGYRGLPKLEIGTEKGKG